ncbi:virulence RhuM family protein [Patescibacteria group bacterium]|nr:virulence RhuM family protein [Patescibacteria group bacterium]
MTDNLPEKSATSSQILLYQTEDGHNRIEVRLENETVWLSQGLMAELFQATKQNISLHIHNIFKEGELDKHSVVKEYLTTARDGKRYKTKYYNLDVIISVGYRVRSYRGTQFRQWATERLREYIVKGFTLDDERLQEPGGLDYFDELIERIRAIRASEKRFYQKIREIYATSIDYNSNHPISREFFATVQNKLHYAITGHTAAELIAERSDATKPYMGLTNWKGSRRRRRFSKADVIVAKNYLNEEELSTLNLIVSQYLDFAELQARGRKPMYMADWKAKLDAFLTLNYQDILTDAGHVSAQLQSI